MLDDITDWHMLGLKLGLTSPTLKRIESDYHEANRRLAEVVNAWLKKQDNVRTASLRSMVSALWKMGEKTTALAIS